jgi:DNA-nicking Smr family endonuclease
MNEPDDTVNQPIDGVLDLHTFRPKEVRSLLDEYIAECRKRGILQIRVIHGKGTGALREMVHAHLARNTAVVSFATALPEAGGWGATIVILKPGTDTRSGQI